MPDLPAGLGRGLICVLPWILGPAAQSRDIILASTTSMRDTGLLDSLLPIFEARTGYRVKLIAVGTGQALTIGKRGDADVVLVHAPEAERVLFDSGYFARRRLVMHNQFLIVGPPSDSAQLRGMPDAALALRKLAERRARFVSRGDNSGTEIREVMLWRKAGLARPQGQPWYIEAGQGMGATLQMASEKGAYTLTMPELISPGNPGSIWFRSSSVTPSSITSTMSSSPTRPTRPVSTWRAAARSRISWSTARRNG